MFLPRSASVATQASTSAMISDDFPHVKLFSSLSSSKPPSRIMVHIQNIPNRPHPVGIVFIRAFTELPGFVAALCDVAAPVCSPAVSFVGRCVVRESAWPFSSLDFFLRTRSMAFQPIISTVASRTMS